MKSAHNYTFKRVVPLANRTVIKLVNLPIRYDQEGIGWLTICSSKQKTQ